VHAGNAICNVFKRDAAKEMFGFLCLRIVVFFSLQQQQQQFYK